MTDPYSPIDCGLHDELQLRVMKGRAVDVTWVDTTGALRHRTGRLLDVFSRAGAEFLRLEDESEIRLDQLREVDGLSFRSASC
jgi:transcriptional antiterminator Rof (Rho-off)